MISKKFLQSSVIYSIVGALPYASGFILIFWFTRLLTPAQFGINVLYISMMYFIQIISSFGLDMSAAVMYIDYKDNAGILKQFLGTILLGLFVFGLVAACLFSFGGFQIFSKVFSGSDVLLLIPFGLVTILSAILNGVFKTYSALLIYQQRPIRFFWLNITNFGIVIGSSLALLYLFPFTLYGPIFGRLFASVVASVISVWFLTKEYGFEWNKSFFKPILSYTTPLMIYALLTWVVSYIDRFIILRYMTDPTFVGIYDFGVKLVLGIELLLVGLVNVVNPKVYTIWKDEGLSNSTVEVNRYYNGLTAFILILIPLFVLLAPILIPLVIKKEIYYQAFGLLSILAAGYASRIWFYMFMAPLMFFKRTKVMPRVFAISALFEIIAAIFMIQWFGLMGAVWINFLVKPLQALLLYRESRKVFRYNFNRWKIIYLPVIFMTVVVVSEGFITDQTRFFFHAGQLLLSILLVWFAFRKELVPFLNTLRRGTR
ncbi:MAG: lipopolysaccharide biosynthesis protein [Bacteroidales bacterium]|nr:lipopolysaccharide biosynthesis protein [Bacteroidales bacterium]